MIHEDESRSQGPLPDNQRRPTHHPGNSGTSHGLPRWARDIPRARHGRKHFSSLSGLPRMKPMLWTFQNIRGATRIGAESDPGSFYSKAPVTDESGMSQGLCGTSHGYSWTPSVIEPGSDQGKWHWAFRSLAHLMLRQATPNMLLS